MKKQLLAFLFVFALFLGFSLQAQAALTTIGQAQYGGQNYNLIWDNDSPFGSIVWLDYTKSYANWQTQVDWAAGLNSGGLLTYNIYPTYNVTWSGDWRLPSTVDGPYVWGYNGSTTAGYNITSSEMGHLFYTELGNKGYYATNGTYPQTGWGLTKTGDFQNLQSRLYWSGTEYAVYTGTAWNFLFGHGVQTYNTKDNGSVLAVRPGDVSVAVVPEPVSVILFGVGGVVMAARRIVKRWRD